jgi:hypothetical protein
LWNDVDFHSRHSLSAGGPGASSALFAPVGSPLDTLFPQESRTFRSNQLERFLNKKTAGKLAFLRVYLQLERLHDAAVNFFPF